MALAIVLAIVLVVIAIGGVIFHFYSPWWFTEIDTNWQAMDDTINLTFWITGIVFIAILLFVAYCVVRFRYQENRPVHYQPEHSVLEYSLIVATTVGVIALLAPGLWVYASFVEVPEEATEVEAVGQQWRWGYRLPGADGKLGTSDIRLVSADNPLGINPDDPNGQDDLVIPDGDLHLPLGKPVKFLLRSKDVLHNFYVPQFRAKMDLVPGHISYFWVEPTRAGRYEVLCAELCGMGHYTMRSHIVIEEQDDYDSWLAALPTFADTQRLLAETDVQAGEQLYATCVACHGARGEGNQALNAPKLAGLEPWYSARQLEKFKQGVRGTHEEDTYGQQMQAMANVLPDAAAINNVAAYIDTLPDEPAATTLDGNEARGRRLYRHCATCHGIDGQGVWSTGAPPLRGMDDWYLARQLNNFRSGIRGAHAQDELGGQMVSVANSIPDDQAVEDLVAYINSLNNN